MSKVYRPGWGRERGVRRHSDLTAALRMGTSRARRKASTCRRAGQCSSAPNTGKAASGQSELGGAGPRARGRSALEGGHLSGGAGRLPQLHQMPPQNLRLRSDPSIAVRAQEPAGRSSSPLCACGAGWETSQQRCLRFVCSLLGRADLVLAEEDEQAHENEVDALPRMRRRVTPRPVRASGRRERVDLEDDGVLLGVLGHVGHEVCRKLPPRALSQPPTIPWRR